MRHIPLALLLTLAPGLALAQTPPAPSPGAPWPGPGMGYPGPGGPMRPAHRGAFGPEQMLLDFYTANTTHDGHLTLAQAKAANFRPVIDHFAEIDVKKRGYITFYDIEAWRLDDLAQHLEQRANALRAQD
ncbi:hypothetical protein [Acidocella sp.]|uniref:hypothetical protein n=1 Tax=Acidocella sp. TaxID=50710 RepID=UPI00260CFEFA|nr:hypothetical protein [Acidocella sp.]